MNQWTIKSGNYAAADSQKQGFCFLLNFNSNLAYEYGFVRADNGLRHSGDDTTSESYQFTYGSSSYLKNAYDNFYETKERNFVLDQIKYTSCNYLSIFLSVVLHY